MNNNNHFSVREAWYIPFVDGYTVGAKSDVPCHLFMRWSNRPPSKHKIPIYRRGLYVFCDIDIAFPVYLEIEQLEDGDTLEHTFTIHDWLCGVRGYWYLWGMIAGQLSPSTTAYFEFKSKASHWFTFPAHVWSGHIYANENSYNATRNKSHGIVEDTKTGSTIGQSKEGLEGFYIWRGGLFFDTSKWPKRIKALGAKIEFDIYHGGKNSAINDDNQLLTILKWPETIEPPLLPIHYGEIGNMATVVATIDKWTWITGVPGTVTVDLGEYGVIFLNKKGLTKFSLRGSHDINNIPDEGFIERNRYDFKLPTPTFAHGPWLHVLGRCY